MAKIPFTMADVHRTMQMTLTVVEPARKKQGFATMHPAAVAQLAKMGGRAAQKSGRANKWTPEQAREMGSKGGKTTAARRRAR